MKKFSFKLSSNLFSEVNELISIVVILFEFIFPRISVSIPALILLIFQRTRIKDVVKEFKGGNKKAILLVGFSWGIMLIEMLRTYQFGTVTTIAPLMATTTILNVFVAFFMLKEKDSIWRKILAAVIVVMGIVLIKI